MKTTGWMLLAALAIGMAFVADPAAAADKEKLAQRLEALDASFAAHAKAKDGAGLRGDLDTAVVLHADAEGEKALRKKIIKLMVAADKSVDDDATVQAMLLALAKTKDDGATSEIKSHLNQRDKKKATPVLMTAIEAAGLFPHAKFVNPLLKIFFDSKVNTTAGKALEALGSYHGVKRYRVKILEATLKEVRRLKPGVKGDMKEPQEGEQASATGEEQSNRWAALAPILPKALGRLTGAEHYGATAADWFTMYDDNKRKLEHLFMDD